MLLEHRAFCINTKGNTLSQEKNPNVCSYIVGDGWIHSITTNGWKQLTHLPKSRPRYTKIDVCWNISIFKNEVILNYQTVFLSYIIKIF